MGEQPNPWDLLQPQDVTSRHRGAKTPPVDMSSWGRSACYPRRTFYPLSDGPFHAEPPDHYALVSNLVRHVCLSVKRPCAIALYTRLPTVLRAPLEASVTLLEATTPVKLPTTHCSLL